MIRVFYYFNNVGDELSRYIVEKLSGEKVKYCNPFSWSTLVHNYCSAIKQLLFNHIDVIPQLLAFSSKKVLVGVGSLIESSTSNCIIWGAGMAQANKLPKGGNFLITRGYESKKLLENNGFIVKSKLAGDPALLMPIIFNPKSERIKGRIGVIPHISEYKEINSLLLGTGFEIINFRTNQIEETIKLLLTCDFIYSSSLHGIILSHAYGIKCVRFFKNDIGGVISNLEIIFLLLGLVIINLYQSRMLLVRKYQIKYNYYPLRLLFVIYKKSY